MATFRRTPEAPAAAPAHVGSAMASAAADLLETRVTGAGPVFDPARFAGVSERAGQLRAGNFVGEMLAPAWTERNQLVAIDRTLLDRIGNRVRESVGQSGRAEYDAITSRMSATDRRRERLTKILISAIDGMPDESLGADIVNAEANAYLRPRVEISLRPSEELLSRLFAHVYGWGPIQPLMDDDKIREITVNDWQTVFVERRGSGDASLTYTGIHWESPDAYMDFLNKMTMDMMRPLGVDQPLADFVLPDGSRGNATYFVSEAPSLTIRRFVSEKPFTLDVLVDDWNSLSPAMRDFMHAANRAGVNLMTYGETGSGKTTFLGALLDDKPADKRLVILEDPKEINIIAERHPNVVRMMVKGNITMRDLVKNALRQRPDNIIVGETRDGTAYDLLQAFAVGTQGSMSTLHAASSIDALERLTGLILQAGIGITEAPVRRMVTSAINVLVHCVRLPNGQRVVGKIDEVMPLGSEGEYHIQTVFSTNVQRDEDGTVTYQFVHNPNYSMGDRLRSLWSKEGLEPDEWNGEAVRSAVSPQ